MPVQDAHSSNAAAPIATADGVIVETRQVHAGDVEEASRRVFLSPRVVDHRAFADFSGQLQTLIRDATVQTRTLVGAAQEVRGLTEQLRGLMKELQVRIDAAAKALPTLDARVTKAQQLLGRVTQEAAQARARELREEVTRELTAHKAALIDQIREEVASELRALATGTLEEARAQWSQADPSQAPGGSMLIPTGEDLTALARRADTITGGFEQSAERAEARLLAVQASAESALERAEQGQRSLEESLLRTQLRLTAVAGDTEKRTEAVAGEISEQLAALRADADRISRETRAELSRSAAGTNNGVKETETGRQIAARALDDLREHAAGVTDAARKTIEQAADRALARLSGKLMQARAVAAGLRPGAAPRALDRALLTGIVTDLENTEALPPAKEAAVRLASLTADAERVLAQTRDSLQALAAWKRDTDRARPGLDNRANPSVPGGPSLAELAVHAQQVGIWLGQVVHSAQQVGAALEALTHRAQAGVAAGRGAHSHTST